MKHFWKFILLIIGAGFSESSESQCETSCSRSSWWKYQPGNIYNYKYVIESKSLMVGTSEQESVFNIEAKLQISPITPCSFVLKIVDAKLTSTHDPSVSRALNQQLTAHTLEFGFDAGRVRTVCPHEHDPIWVVNIKKGILSAFQQSYDSPTESESLIETDITGECETVYTPSGINWDHHTIRKEKKMETCLSNQVLYQYALNIPDINIQHLPLLRSKHGCDITVNSGKLIKSVCKEDHQFKPFSNGDNGAMSLISQVLSFEEETPGKLTSDGFKVRTSLKFVHNHERADDSADQEHVLSLLRSYSTIKESEISTLFNNLVYSLRNLDQAQLLRSFRSIQDHPETKHFFLDALPILKTDAGVSLMKEIIVSGGVDSEKIDSWFNSLIYYKNPTRAMISILSQMLYEPRKSSILGVSTLISTFCSNHESCFEFPEVQDALRILQSLLGESCEANNPQEEDIVILALKGIRNIRGYYEEGTVIKNCYESKQNSYWVRLAALDTMRRMSCSFPNRDKSLIQLMNDKQENSEMRIGAYLVLFDCPSDANVKAIKDLMETEEVNQVGSFMWTHLTNIQESKSKDRWKVYLKNFIGSEVMQNKWNTDPRKFSRNLEVSHFINDYRIGGSLDTNIIFAEESYIPRSTMLNFTANIFGENINVFEIGGRVAGFEDTVEDIFGPQGYLKEDTIYKFVKSLRQKRSTESDLKSLGKEYKAGLRESIPRGNMYMRFFDKDVYYNSFQGISSLLDKSMTQIMHSFGFSSQANKISYSHSNMFLDGSVIIPTVLGMPLNLTVNGTSTLRFNSENNIDIKNLFSKGQAIVHSKIDPVMNLEISALMSVDAFYAKTGLKSVTRLHTSTFIDIHAEIDGGKLANLQINLPHDKSEILEASADFSIFTNHEFKPLETTHEQESINTCSPTLLSDTLGLKYCLTGSYYSSSTSDAPKWYFRGPVRAEITMMKADKFDSIVANYKWKKEAKFTKGEMQSIDVVIDTPGSTINRKSYLQIQFNNLLSYFIFDLSIPLRESHILIEYDWSNLRKIIRGRFRRLGSDVINFQTKLDAYPRKYEGVVDLTFLDTQILNWKGTFYNISNRYRIDATLNSYYHKPVLIKGNYRVKDGTWRHTTIVTSDDLECSLRGTAYRTRNGFKSDSKINYNIWGTYEGKVQVMNKYRAVQSGMLDKKDISFHIKPSAYPDYDIKVDWTIEQSVDFLKNKIEISLHDDVWFIDQQFDSRANMKEQELIVQLGVRCPNRAVIYGIDFHHKMVSGVDNESFNKLLLQLSEAFKAEVYIKHKEKSFPYHFEAEGGIIFGDKKLALGVTLYNPGVDDKTYIGSMQLFLPNKKEGQINFSLARGNSQFLDYHLASNATFTDQKPISVVGKIVYTDESAEGDFIWKYDDTTYKASFEHDMLGNTKIRSQFSLFGVDYEGEVNLRAGDVEKEVLIDVKGTRRIYVTVKYMADLTKLQLKGYWNKDVDDNKSIQLNILVRDSIILAEITLNGKSGKIELGYSQQSISGKVIWGNFSSEVNLILQFESKHVEVLLSVKTSLTALKDITLHLLLATKGTDLGKSTETKVEIKLNEYHHMARFLHIKEKTRKIFLETISTFHPFNAIFLDLELLFDDLKSDIDFLFKYHEFYVKLNIDHLIDNREKFDVKGSCKVESSLQFIKNVIFIYDIKWNQTNEIKSLIKFDFNDKNVLNAKVNGTADNEKVDTDFIIDLAIKSFKEKYFGSLQCIMINHEINTKLKLNTRLSSYDATLNINISEEMMVSGTLESSGAVPIRSWFTISSNTTEYIVHAEVKLADIQYFALNLEYKNDDNGYIITTAVNVFLRVYAFKVSLVPGKVLLLIEDKMESEIFNKVFLQLKTQEVTELVPEHKASLKFSVQTEYEVFDGIDAYFRYHGNSVKQKAEANFKYKNYFVESKAYNKNNNDDTDVLKISMFTNFMNRNMSYSIQSKTKENYIDLLFTVNEDSYEYNLNLEANLEFARKSINLRAFGTDGNWTLQSFAEHGQNEIHLDCSFVDRKDLTFKFTGNCHLNEKDKNLNLSFITPFTDKLTVKANLRMLDEIQFSVDISQPSFVYAKASARMQTTHNKVDLQAKFDFKSLIFLPVTEFNFQASMNEPTNASSGSITSELKLNEEQVFKVDSTFSKLPNEIKLNLATKIYYWTSDVNLKFSNFDDIVAETTMRINGVENIVALVYSHNDTSDHLHMKANIPTFNYIDVLVDVLYDSKTQFVGFKTKLNQNFLNFNVQCISLTDINAVFESNIYSWSSFEIKLSADLDSQPKVIKISGESSNKVDHIDMDITLASVSGEVILDLHLPFLSINNKNIKVSYAMEENKYKLFAKFNEDTVDIDVTVKENEVSFSIKSPFPYIENVTGTMNYKIDNDFNFDVKMNLLSASEPLYFKVYLNTTNKYAAEFSIQSNQLSVNNVSVRLIIEKDAIDVFIEFGSHQFLFKSKLHDQNADIFISLKRGDKIDRIVIGASGGSLFYNKEKEIDLVLTIDYNIMSYNGSVNIYINDNTIFFNGSQYPHLGEWRFRVEWSKDSAEIELTSNGTVLLKFKLKKEIIKQSKIDLLLSVETVLDYLRNFDLALAFDVDDIDDKNYLNFKYRYNKSYFDLKFNFEANLDKFDGTFVLTSSIKSWENAIIDLHYDLGDNTKILVKLKRNDNEDLIDIDISTDGLKLQTIKLVTPFVGYENITLLGMLRRDDFYEIQLKINEETFLRLYLRFQSRDNYGIGDLRASLEFPNYSYKNMNWNMTYDMSNSVNMKASFARSQNVYFLTVTEDTMKNVLIVNFKTPFNDFEINGIFGTKEFSTYLSHGKSRQKRSIGMSFDGDGENINLSFATPFENFSGFDIKSRYHSDARVLAFSFHKYGLNRFSVGLDYNITDFPNSGLLAGELLIESHGIDYEGRIQYQVNDSESSSIGGMFFLKEKKQVLVSGRLSRILGKSQLQIETPMNGWKNVSLSLESDWINKISLGLERDGMISRICINKLNTTGFSVDIVSPYTGYEHIQTIVMIPRDQPKHIEILKNGQMLTKLELDFKLDLAQVTGFVLAKLEAINDTYVILSLDLESSLTKLQIKTSYPKLKNGKLEIFREMVDQRQNNKIKLHINDYFVHYNTSTLWTHSFIDSISYTMNNIPALSFNTSETRTKITFSKAFDAPFTLKFISIADGVKTFDVFSSIVVNFKNSGIELLYRGDFPLHNGKINAKLLFKQNQSTILELVGHLVGVEFDFTMKQVPGNAEAKFKSNLENFEDIQGKATWVTNKGANKEFGFEASMNYNFTKLVGISLWFTTNPVSDISVSLVVQDYLNESLDVKVQHSNPSTYNIHMSYLGFNNIDATFHIDSNEYAIKADVENFSQQRKWLLELQGLMKSRNPIKIAFKLNLETPFSDRFKSSLHIDFINDEKTVKCVFSYGSILASAEANVLWLDTVQKLHINIVCPTLNIHNLDVNLEKENSEHIKFEMTFNKKKVRLEIINKIIGTSFLIGLDLSLPIDEYEKIIFFGKGKADFSNQDAENYGIFVVETSSGKYDLKYELSEKKLGINVRTPLSYSKNIKLEASLDISSRYNIAVNWDNNLFEFNHQLNQTLSNLKIDFKTSVDYLQDLVVLFSLNEKSMILEGYVRGTLIDLELSLDCMEENEDTQIKLIVKQRETSLQGFLETKSNIAEKMLNAIIHLNSEPLIKVNSAILLENDMIDFKLKFSVPLYKLTETSCYFTFLQRPEERIGKFEILINNTKTVVECGSKTDLLFLKVRSPSSELTMNLNHLDKNMHLALNTLSRQIKANISQHENAHYFSVSADMNNETVQCTGNVDFRNINFNTNLVWKKIKGLKQWESHIKVLVQAKKLELSLKTPSFVFKNILLIGKWVVLDNGFSANFSADVNDVLYNFESKFEINNDIMTGFWKIIDQREKEMAAFEVSIVFKEYGTKFKVNLTSMWGVNANLNINFAVHENKFECGFNLLSNKLLSLSNITVKYMLDYKTLTNLHMKAEVLAPDLVFSSNQEFRMLSLSNVTIKSYTNIPKLSQLLDIEFKLLLVSHNNFLFSSKFKTNDIDVGGGLSYLKLGSKVDIVIDIAKDDLKKVYKLGGEFHYPAPTGEIAFYFNDAKWYSKFNLEDISFDIEAFVNFRSLIQATRFGNVEDETTIVAEKIEVKLSFVERYLKFNVGVSGDGETSLFFFKDDKIMNGEININYPNYEIKKYGKVNMKFGTSGEIQITLLDGNESVDIEIIDSLKPKIRRTRAVLNSPTYGSIVFEERSKFSKGVIIINSGENLHKFVYEVKKTDGYDLNMAIESPLLQNGTALITLNINEKLDQMRGSLNLNNKYFISSSVKFVSDNIEVVVTIDTTEQSSIPDGTYLKASYKKVKNTYTVMVDVNFISSNTFSVVFTNDMIYSLDIDINSRYVAFSPITFKANSFMSLQASKSFVSLVYQKETVSAEFDHNYNDLLQFDSKLKYSISALNNLNHMVQISWDFNRKKETKVTIVQNDERIELISKLRENKSIQTLFLTPFKGYERFEIDAHLNTWKSFNEINFDITFVTLTGETISNIDLRIKEDSLVLITKLNTPSGKTYFQSLQFSLSSGLIWRSMLPYLDLTRIDIIKINTEENNLYDHIIVANIDILDQEYNGRFTVTYTKGYELSAIIEIPNTDWNKQELKIGFSDLPERKMAKAFVDCEFGKSGLGIDARYTSVNDLHFEAFIDFPLPDWSDINVVLSNQIFDNLKSVQVFGQYNDKQIQAQGYLSDKLNEINLKVNDYALDVENLKINSVFGNQAILSNAAFKTPSNTYSASLDLDDLKFVQGLLFDLRDSGSNLLKFHKLPEINSVKIVSNIKSFSVDIDAVYDVNVDVGDYTGYSGVEVKNLSISDISIKNLALKYRILKTSTNLIIQHNFTKNKQKLTLWVQNSQVLDTFSMALSENSLSPKFEVTIVSHQAFSSITVSDITLVLVSPYGSMKLGKQISSDKTRTVTKVFILNNPETPKAYGLILGHTHDYTEQKAIKNTFTIQHIGNMSEFNSADATILQTNTDLITSLKINGKTKEKSLSTKVSLYWKESIESIIGTTKLEYQIANYQPNEITAGITYKIEDNLIDLFLESRGVKLDGKIKARHGKESDAYSFILYLNDVKKLSALYDYNSKKERATLDMFVIGDVSVNVFAGFASRSDIALKVSHSFRGSATEDSRFQISLVEGQEFQTTLKWRKSIMKELLSYAKWIHYKYNFDNLDFDLKPADTVNILHDFCLQSMRLISLDSIDKRIDELEKDLLESVDIFINYVGKHPHSNKLLLIYIKESFYHIITNSMNILRNFATLANNVKKIIENLINGTFNELHHMIHSAEHHMESLKAKIKYIDEHIDEYLEIAFAKLGHGMELLRSKLNKLAEIYQTYVSKYSGGSQKIISRFILQFKSDIQSFVKTYNDFIDSYQVGHQAFEYYQEIRDWLHYFQILEHLKYLYGTVQRFMINSWSLMVEAYHNVLYYTTKVIEYTEGVVKRFSMYPPVAKAIIIIEKVMHIGENIVVLVMKDIKIRRTLDSLLSRANLLSSLIFRFADFLINSREIFAYNIIYTPEDGLVQFTQSLPIHWYEFHEISNLFEIFKPADTTPWDVTDFYLKARDAIRDFDIMIQTKTVFPPFSGTAMLMGNKHILTFDGKIFDFGGKCSYVLVSDFMYNKFSVIAHYQDEIQKSFSILVDNKEIQLFTDGRLFIDGQRYELPVKEGSSYIVRIGNRIKVHNSNGFLVDLNLVQNLCTVKLSGWFFGRTGGLFGVYDNEASNDWMLPSHVITDDLQTFTDSWQVGPPCQENYSPLQNSTITWDQEKCYNLFINRDSNLRPCFGIIDPTPFYEVCLKEMALPNVDFTAGFCQASMAYVENCRVHGSGLDYPLECISCQVPDNPKLAGGHNVRYTTPVTNSADVILVVEQTWCNADLNLTKVVMSIDAAMNQAGLMDNKYALVGYGGKDKMQGPQLFTSYNQVFTNVHKLVVGFNRLDFQGPGSRDLMAPLEYALRMTVRPAVGKTLIVFNCDSIYDSKVYKEISVILRDNDVRLHSVSPLHFTLNLRRQYEPVIGYSDEEVFTTKSIKHSFNNGRIYRRYLEKPVGHTLAYLASSSGGLTFSTNYMTDYSKDLKVVSAVFGMEVARLAHPTDCQLCDCMVDDEGEGKVLCQRCISTSIDFITYQWNKFGAGINIKL